jgi:hypothetical protein
MVAYNTDDDSMVNVDLKQWTVMGRGFQIINGLQSLTYALCLAAYFYHYHRAITKFNKLALVVFGMGLSIRTVMYQRVYVMYS